jgi:hypothetical protein
VPDPRTDRIATLAEQLTALQPLEPRTVRLARRAHDAARRDLRASIARRDPERIVSAMRYRAERTADLLHQRWAQALG